MLRRQSDLLLGVILTVILIGLSFSGLQVLILQRILVIPYVLLVPGYALMSAIFTSASLPQIEKLIISSGLSIGIVILSGLVLNITPWGIQMKSWILILSIITLAASGIAIFRRWRSQENVSAPVRFSIPFHQVAMLGLAIVIVSFAVKLSFTPQTPYNIQGYSSLWILPTPESSPDTLLIGIHSQELETTRYNLLITYNGQPKQEWPDISLSPGNEWQQSIIMPAGQGVAEAILYRVDNPGIIYRRVSIMLNNR